MYQKKSREERNLKFETLQLHVGQEQADPATDARAVPITRHLLMSFTTVSTQRPDLI